MLVFEPPGEPVETDIVSENEFSTIQEFWNIYLNNVFDETIRVEYLGMTNYMNEDKRKDPLYAIDTTDYTTNN